ncbi:MAG TPA: efflux RND transporter permease subunit, partial [Kofleriaceae bacterium]|nr:efflux RND transporter permease subunit [Kofleriaceae bacterium]
VQGVAQVVPIGGGMRQYQVEVDPDRLRRYGVTLAEVAHAIETSNQNSTGGFVVRGPQQNLVRGLGRLRSTEDLARVVVATRDNTSISVGQVAHVHVGAATRLGEGSVDGKPAVVMAITKQPGSNTIALTGALDRELDAIAKALPKGMALERQLFRQSEFIEAAVDNVTIALRDGAILVVVIIFLFLVNARATAISAIALPISLLVAVIALEQLDAGIDTMTLGGLTIAIGALVDDAIIDVENVVRRLRENAGRRPPSEIIYEASREVRGSIVFATIIVMLVFVPVFFLTGVEGRLLFPLGFAYLVAIFASLVVALTVTPALCALLLPKLGARAHGDSFVVRHLKRAYTRALDRALRHGTLTIAIALLLAAGAGALLPLVGRSFLPAFNEGALTINAVTLPGTSLAESDARGRRIEETLLGFPEVVSTTRRTGRAELDEHAQDVNATEIEVRLRPAERSREAFLAELRGAFARIPGTAFTIGQPISHRIDHMLSGTRAAVAIKLFGEDLFLLRQYAEQIRRAIEPVEGAVDVSIEQQVDIPQLVVDFDLDRVARAGTHRGELAETMEIALAGKRVTQVVEGQRTYDVVVRYAPRERDIDDLRALPLDVPNHGLLPLGMLADVRRDVGPNTITRESTQRKMVIMANVSGRDLGSVVADMRARIEAAVKLPEGYHVAYGGQFESQERASETLLLLGFAVIVAIFLVLQLAFASSVRALVVMANLPLALIGGVVAIFLTDRIVSIGSLVGFITLFGIATRNGIMLLSHYEHLRTVEGASLEETVRRGSLERLSPVLMTALCAGLALVPLVLAAGEPGNEIQAPMGVVILGGLATSTLLNLFVVPALYAKVARRGYAT